ncbi:hypothetical protein L210DRAFT_2541034 [Boletus edulis BED1]|uniref:Uncharacterized protein n=1 Tax=Boletus edulis BED1 TaxID=1328754 RepID=A0AAD4GBN8_BOLED|nr:hypothetical protein L210DRAFT_2541034 [Boletus edulis BED1]
MKEPQPAKSSPLIVSAHPYRPWLPNDHATQDIHQVQSNYRKQIVRLIRHSFSMAVRPFTSSLTIAKHHSGSYPLPGPYLLLASLHSLLSIAEFPLTSRPLLLLKSKKIDHAPLCFSPHCGFRLSPLCCLSSFFVSAPITVHVFRPRGKHSVQVCPNFATPRPDPLYEYDIFCSTLFTVGGPSFSACTLVAGQRDVHVLSHHAVSSINASD